MADVSVKGRIRVSSPVRSGIFGELPRFGVGNECAFGERVPTIAPEGILATGSTGSNSSTDTA